MTPEAEAALALLASADDAPGDAYAVYGEIARELVALRQRVDGKLVGLTLPEPPSANRWWRSRVVTPKGMAPFASTYLSEEAREYKDNLATIVRTRPHTCDVRVFVDWYRGIRSGDLDKRIGVLADALQGSFYLDDKQVVEWRARRFDDPGRDRVVVRVEPVPGAVVQTSLLEAVT